MDGDRQATEGRCDDANIATVSLDNTLAYSQAQTGATGAAIPGCLNPVEVIKQQP